MSDGRVFAISVVAAILGGLVVAAFVSEQAQKTAQNVGRGLVPNPKGLSPMISGFNRPLELDSQN